jgi:hypothetical protein
MRVNKINWDKIGRVTEPGRYRCFFGYLTVTSEDIEVWTRYPDATFTLITLPTTEQSVGEDYRLGAFDIGNPELASTDATCALCRPRLSAWPAVPSISIFGPKADA